MFSRVPLSCCSSRGLPRSGPHCPRCAGSATAGGAATRAPQPPVENNGRLSGSGGRLRVSITLHCPE